MSEKIRKTFNKYFCCKKRQTSESADETPIRELKEETSVKKGRFRRLREAISNVFRRKKKESKSEEFIIPKEIWPCVTLEHISEAEEPKGANDRADEPVGVGESLGFPHSNVRTIYIGVLDHIIGKWSDLIVKEAIRSCRRPREAWEEDSIANDRANDSETTYTGVINHIIGKWADLIVKEAISSCHRPREAWVCQEDKLSGTIQDLSLLKEQEDSIANDRADVPVGDEESLEVSHSSIETIYIDAIGDIVARWSDFIVKEAIIGYRRRREAWVCEEEQLSDVSHDMDLHGQQPSETELTPIEAFRVSESESVPKERKIILVKEFQAPPATVPAVISITKGKEVLYKYDLDSSSSDESFPLARPVLRPYGRDRVKRPESTSQSVNN
ncbi:hypothetical protein XENTR_v10017898 [Xenopus tropicalis]|nr:hypothetical protein XENTR_v10017898 [Xenopus tropicalis]